MADIVLLFFTVCLGLACGSFISMASYRMPRDMPMMLERSKCTSCKKALGVADLMPVLSWLMQNGKCRHCKEVVSIRYPLIELVTGFGFGLICYMYGPTYHAVIMMLVFVALAIATVVDIEHLIIPDRLQIALLILAIGRIAIIPELHWKQHFLSAGLALLIALLLRSGVSRWKGQESLGLGDVKLIAVSGLFLTYDYLVIYFFVAGVLGIIFGVLWGLCGKGKLFPFGPALATSLFLCLLIIEGSGVWNILSL